MKPVKSTNPLKPIYMDALKRLSGGTKVTNVKESDEAISGDCFLKAGNKEWTRLGTFVESKETIAREVAV